MDVIQRENNRLWRITLLTYLPENVLTKYGYAFREGFAGPDGPTLWLIESPRIVR